MHSIETNNSIVHFNQKVYNELNNYLKKTQPSKVFILTDTNTHHHCLPYFLTQIDYSDTLIEVMEMPYGESHKTLEICLGVWEALSEYLADRNSLMINLGGGVVTDLGGFVASTYLRGLSYINVPTSLLAMVDASVGGKTGIDLGHLKNHIGVINEGSMVLIDAHYLKTLPEREVISGYAEILKHGLISSLDYWETVKQINFDNFESLADIIHQSVKIKQSIVSEDINEAGLRKILNFGHTLGHAVESYFLNRDEDNALLHGEAIAIGLILESFLSHHTVSLSEDALYDISNVLISTYGKTSLPKAAQNEIVKLLIHDKKNSHGKIQFVLLQDIGQPILDQTVSDPLIYKAFDYYNSL